MWEGTAQSLEGPDRRKGNPKDEFVPSSWTGTSIISCLRHCGSFSLSLKIVPLAPLVLKPWDLNWIIPLAFLVLLLEDSKLWGLTSKIT
jgi:hypothetical protein